MDLLTRLIVLGLIADGFIFGTCLLVQAVRSLWNPDTPPRIDPKDAHDRHNEKKPCCSCSASTDPNGKPPHIQKLDKSTQFEDLSTERSDGRDRTHDANKQPKMKEVKKKQHKHSGNTPEGRAEVVSMPDGDRTCSAVLLRERISSNIRRAVAFQQNYRKERFWAEDQIRQIEQFETMLALSAKNKQSHLMSTLQNEPRASEKIARLRSDLEVLELLGEGESKKVRDQKRGLCNRTVSEGATVMQRLHLSVMTELEGAFVKAQMVEPQDTKPKAVEFFDLKKEFLRLSNGREYEPSLAPGQWPRDQEAIDKWEAGKAERDAEEKREGEMMQAIYDAMDARDDLREKYYEQVDIRDQEWRQRCEQDEEPSMTEAEFKLDWAERKGLSVQGLRDAQDHLNEVKTEALEADVEVYSYVPSLWRESEDPPVFE